MLLFIDKIFMYVENPKESLNKPSELNAFIKDEDTNLTYQNLLYPE